MAGTSGRFVAAILWNMLQNTTNSLTFSAENSAHAHGSYANSWGENLGDRCNAVDIYDTFNFLPSSDIGILTTHIYPKFEVINYRLSNSKIIIISYDEDDLIEIASNRFFKNHYEGAIAYDSKDNSNSATHFFLKNYLEVFGIPYEGPVSALSIDDIRKLIIHTKNSILQKEFAYVRPYFNNPIIPESMKDRTLVLPYKDLFIKDENNYIGLTKIAAFANRTPNASTIDSYQRYVDGRNAFLKKNLPWVTP